MHKDRKANENDRKNITMISAAIEYLCWSRFFPQVFERNSGARRVKNGNMVEMS